MSAAVLGEEREATELLDETQRLRQKRDLLTKENEQLKTYLRLRQMESTATCEQLKSEIEQQIEQFEALGDQSFNENQASHLETLKSFRAEIEAIQCWNAKIRNKYFSRTSSEESARNLANQLTDELIEQMVASSSVCSSEVKEDNKECDNKEADAVIAADRSENTNKPKPKKSSSNHKRITKKDRNVSSEEGIRNKDSTSNGNIKTRLRSKPTLIDSTTDEERKRTIDKEDNTSQMRLKRRRK